MQKNTSHSQNEQKILVAITAIDDLVSKNMLCSGMKVGLGTGSTAMHALERLAWYLAEKKLTDIKAVPTSFQTTLACETLHIPFFSMNSSIIGGQLDISIDGADEITPEKYLIKGGGAAHLLEKIIAYNTERFVIIADESKAVQTIGTQFPLPVEIIAEARMSVINAIKNLGAASVVLRQGVKKAGPVITDNGNLILDCLWNHAIDAKEMEDAINNIAGVVENGLFTKNIPTVYISSADGSIKVL